MFVHAMRGEWQSAHQAALQLEPYGFAPQRAAVALLRDDVQEFKRIRDSRSAQWKAIYTTQLLSLAPTQGTLTAELLAAAKQAVELKEPRSSWLLGVAEYRAGQFQSAVDRLGSLVGSADGCGIAMPVLAMAYHELGDAAQAQR
jgi:Flp pilus assembly protein TadD